MTTKTGAVGTRRSNGETGSVTNDAELVKLFAKTGAESMHRVEHSMELVQPKMKVSRNGDRCFIDFATPEGGMELEMAPSMVKTLSEKLAAIIE